MEIKFKDGGMWGGVTPDVLKTGKVTIEFENVELHLSLEEFEKLRNSFDDFAIELYNKSQFITRVDLKQDAMVHKIGAELEKLIELARSRSPMDMSVIDAYYDMKSLFNEYWLVKIQ